MLDFLVYQILVVHLILVKLVRRSGSAWNLSSISFIDLNAVLVECPHRPGDIWLCPQFLDFLHLVPLMEVPFVLLLFAQELVLSLVKVLDLGLGELRLVLLFEVEQGVLVRLEEVVDCSFLLSALH